MCRSKCTEVRQQTSLDSPHGGNNFMSLGAGVICSVASYQASYVLLPVPCPIGRVMGSALDMMTGWI